MQHLADVTPQAAEEAAIDIEGLSHVYSGVNGEVPALQDISMRVGAGRFTVIVGPSGCGKTSLLMMMAGLRAQSSGTLLCHGRPIPAPDPKRVGVVFQEASLYPWLTALENVEFPLSLRGGDKAEHRRRAVEMLALVELEGSGGRYPHELSGGMKQRVSIARGLVQDPPVLLMDEPFAALDEITRQRLNGDLLAWWQSASLAVLFVTHSVFEAVFLSQRVLVMSARPGRVAAEVCIDEPTPRTPEFRTSLRYAQACREVSQALEAAHARDGSGS